MEITSKQDLVLVKAARNQLIANGMDEDRVEISVLMTTPDEVASSVLKPLARAVSLKSAR